MVGTLPTDSCIVARRDVLIGPAARSTDRGKVDDVIAPLATVVTLLRTRLRRVRRGARLFVCPDDALVLGRTIVENDVFSFSCIDVKGFVFVLP